jgi:succinate-acetate transporter protein
MGSYFLCGYYVILINVLTIMESLTKGKSKSQVVEKSQFLNFSFTDKTANPAPLGLMGFGMTTVLLNIHNAGIIQLGSMILAMGIFYGGIAQVIAGVMEWKKGNTFGTTAFTSYGLFWLTLVGLIVLPKMGWAEATTPFAMGFYLLMWGLFTAFMYVGTLKLTRSLQFVFASLTVLFFLLALGDFTQNATIKLIAGIEGIICGASAIYTAIGQVINEVYKKEILPL